MGARGNNYENESKILFFFNSLWNFVDEKMNSKHMSRSLDHLPLDDVVGLDVFELLSQGRIKAFGFEIGQSSSLIFWLTKISVAFEKNLTVVRFWIPALFCYAINEYNQNAVWLANGWPMTYFVEWMIRFCLSYFIQNNLSSHWIEMNLNLFYNFIWSHFIRHTLYILHCIYFVNLLTL